MVLLLQGYVGASDAEAVEMAVMDRRWQLVLDCLDVEEAPFAQGALQAFRERMIENGMDRVLLERTVALVREGAVTTAEGQQLSKAVRVAIDSRPLAGAGRVEDTINLLGHAARNIVKLAAKLTDRSPEEICRKAHPTAGVSVKADRHQQGDHDKFDGHRHCRTAVSSLARWVERRRRGRERGAVMPDAITTVRDQDLNGPRPARCASAKVRVDRRI
jgi:hypothetical protein